MATPQDTGIRQPLHIEGFDLALNPTTIQETPFRAETAERMANSFGVIDRPYLFPDSTDVAPDVVQKFVWGLAWPSVNSADYEVFSEIESLPGYFSFCPWKPLYETFSGDGASKTFRLLRRLANVALTPPLGDWTPKTKVGGTVVTNPTFGTPYPVTDPSAPGTTPTVFSDAPAAAASNVRIFYTPVFLVRVVSPQRNFSTPFAESRTLTLEEI